MESIVIYLLTWTVFLSSGADKLNSQGAEIEKIRRTERYYTAKSTDAKAISATYKGLPSDYRKTAFITAKVRAGGEYFDREAGEFDVGAFKAICNVVGNHVWQEYGKYDPQTATYLCCNCLATKILKYKDGQTVFPDEAMIQ